MSYLIEGVPGLLALAVLMISSLILINSFQQWRREASLRAQLPPVGIVDRLKFLLLTGTDADLKLELVHLLYLFGVVLAGKMIIGLGWRREIEGALVLIGLIQGFHFRQWLSKWRRRNIVFYKILHQSRLVYFQGLRDISALVLNHIVLWYLLWINPIYAIFSFAGFFIHEVSLEFNKSSLLIKRKLHVFDLEHLLTEDPMLRTRLSRAVRRFDMRRIERIIDAQEDPERRLILSGFKLLLADDFKSFRRLYEENQVEIRNYSSALYYFGRAFYQLGEVALARELLSLGQKGRAADLCFPYYVLAVLATRRDRETIEPLLGALRSRIEVMTEEGRAFSKALMFSRAYYALALAISTSDYQERTEGRLASAVYSIHEAMRINQKFYEGGGAGSLSQSYFLANEQIFLDIYGYVVYRMGNEYLSFRILEQAVRSDNTYPWPYYHIALIYEKLGRLSTALALYYRVAANERSSTVLRRLAERRLAGCEEKLGSRVASEADDV